MPLTAGTQLGPYEIISALGAGGLGEVYRARDATLRRDVALKILPELVAFDPDRVARVRREAQLLASLNHPNIAAIYGFEESTSVHALVPELVEAPTLADRIAHGSLPVDEALRGRCRGRIRSTGWVIESKTTSRRNARLSRRRRYALPGARVCWLWPVWLTCACQRGIIRVVCQGLHWRCLRRLSAGGIA